MLERDFLRRNELLLGSDCVERLSKAFVVVVGLGAVGSFAAEALVRAGVGRLRLVDFDEIRPTNLNRQLFALRSTVGRKKAEVAVERLRDIVPTAQFEALCVFADGTTFPQIFSGSPDVLIDAIDSVGPKAALLRAAVEAGIPHVISSMGAADRGDPLAIRVATLDRTRICPLARQIRKRIRDRATARRILCVFSEEKPWGRRAPREEKESVERGRPRHTLGSLACVTGVFGLVAAREAIRVLCGK